MLKIKEVLSSVLGSAVRYDLLTRNPLTSVRVPRSKVINKKKQKPNITPEEFAQLVSSISEPYATMVYVAVFSGLEHAFQPVLRQHEIEIFLPLTSDIQESLTDRSRHVGDRLLQRRDSRYGLMTFATRQTSAASQSWLIVAFFWR